MLEPPLEASASLTAVFDSQDKAGGGQGSRSDPPGLALGGLAAHGKNVGARAEIDRLRSYVNHIMGNCRQGGRGAGWETWLKLSQAGRVIGHNIMPMMVQNLSEWGIFLEIALN